VGEFGWPPGLCRRYDNSKRERRKTARLGRRLFPGTRKCTVCGEGGPGRRIEIAHVHALEECGLSERDNLVLLCRRIKKKHAERGCHQLFDDGFASQAEIDTLRVAARRTSSLRQTMRARYRMHHAHSEKNQFDKTLARIGAEKSRGALCKAQRIAEAEASKWPAASEKRFILRLKAIEMMRRRAARGSLGEAHRHFYQLLKGSVPKAQRSSLFYEGGCIELLRGRHGGALPYFLESMKAAHSGWKWASAAAFVTQCQVVLAAKRADWDKALRITDKTIRVLEKCGGPDAARWIINVRADRVRVLLAKGEATRAVRAWDEVLNIWKCTTALTGWDAGGRKLIVGLAGVLYAETAQSKEEAMVALRYLTRACVNILGAGRRQPETLRDILFSVAKALQLIGNTKLAAKFRSTAGRTRDGNAWFHPYRTSSKTCARETRGNVSARRG
jgi:hypothetical protein